MALTCKYTPPFPYKQRPFEDSRPAVQTALKRYKRYQFQWPKITRKHNLMVNKKKSIIKNYEY